MRPTFVVAMAVVALGLMSCGGSESDPSTENDQAISQAQASYQGKAQILDTLDRELSLNKDGAYQVSSGTCVLDDGGIIPNEQADLYRDSGDVVLTNGDYTLAITYYVGQDVDLGECGEAARDALGW
jgi:hypothetical protein